MINEKDKDGFTPLILAVFNNHIKLVQYLLSQEDIDVDIEDCCAMTALHWAIRKQETDIVIALLNKGVDVFSAYHLGISLHDFAQERSTLQIQQLIDFYVYD